MFLAPKKIRMAYLLSRYPAISHTFFLKEILGLRRIGFEIETASVNPPDRPISKLPPLEAVEAHSTHYLKQVSFLDALSVLVTITFVHPRVALRGFRAAARLGDYDLSRKIYAFFYMVEAFLLGRWMERRDLHHLHVHFGGSVATVAMLAAEAWGFDYSLTIHGPEEFYEVEHCYLPRKIDQAKFIFCISDFCRSQLMKYCDPAHWDKMHVIRLGVDTEECKPLPQKEKLAFEIVCVGRLVPAKGQHILLRAFSLVRSKGYSVHLTFIGDGPDRPTLEREVSERDLAAHVTVLGSLNHDQTRERVSHADIFALASFAEGVPVALMEAMAMGIPCVSTVVAGIPELIRDKIDGLLVPASSVDAFASAIELLLLDDDSRRRLGASARTRIIECYNLTDNLKLLASMFENCIL